MTTTNCILCSSLPKLMAKISWAGPRSTISWCTWWRAINLRNGWVWVSANCLKHHPIFTWTKFSHLWTLALQGLSNLSILTPLLIGTSLKILSLSTWKSPQHSKPSTKWRRNLFTKSVLKCFGKVFGPLWMNTQQWLLLNLMLGQCVMALAIDHICIRVTTWIRLITLEQCWIFSNDLLVNRLSSSSMARSL